MKRQFIVEPYCPHILFVNPIFQTRDLCIVSTLLYQLSYMRHKVKSSCNKSVLVVSVKPRCV